MSESERERERGGGRGEDQEMNPLIRGDQKTKETPIILRTPFDYVKRVVWIVDEVLACVM